MAIITRGSQDGLVLKIKSILDTYEQLHAGAKANVYRQNSASIRIRVVDPRFVSMSTPDRHDDVWKFISDQLTDDELQEVSILLVLAPQEERSSLMNLEFDDPIPSRL